MSDARQRFFDFMSRINPLTIVFLMCAVFSILTYVIPGGEFERRAVMVMGHERLIVVPGSFHSIPARPQGFLQLWTVFMRGAMEGAERSFLILLAAGAMTAIIATGRSTPGSRPHPEERPPRPRVHPDHGLRHRAVRATFGMYEEGLPFILVIAPSCCPWGSTPWSRSSPSTGAAWASPVASRTPTTSAIGQAIANVPLYSEAWFSDHLRRVHDDHQPRDHALRRPDQAGPRTVALVRRGRRSTASG
jgi:uncharacterized ion transporter superfamily protein YfcC